MTAPVRIVLVEDNAVFREALELLLGLRSDVEVVASVADGTEAVPAVREHEPDVVLMDYRLPGLDGVQATAAVRDACPGVAVVCLTASRNEPELEALRAAGAVTCLSKDQEIEEIIAALHAAAGRGRGVRLDAGNTAIVLDSTADFPEAPERFANWRVVPLYVRFGDESLRDYVDLGPAEFYARLRTAEELPTTSQPTPADFLAVYEGLASYERVLSVHLAGRLSGTLESARRAAAETGGRVRVVDSESASAAIAMLGLAIQRRLQRGTSDEEVDELVGRYRRSAGLLFTVDTLEFLRRGGRIGKAAAMAGQLLNIKPILTIRESEVVPLKRVRGNAKAFAEFVRAFTEDTADRPGLHVGIAHADAPARADALVQMVRRERPAARIDIVTSLGAVVGTHAGPGTVGLFWFADGPTPGHDSTSE